MVSISPRFSSAFFFTENSHVIFSFQSEELRESHKQRILGHRWLPKTEDWAAESIHVKGFSANCSMAKSHIKTTLSLLNCS